MNANLDSLMNKHKNRVKFRDKLIKEIKIDEVGGVKGSKVNNKIPTNTTIKNKIDSKVINEIKNNIMIPENNDIPDKSIYYQGWFKYLKFEHLNF